MKPKECPGRSGSSGSIYIFERLMVHSAPFSKQDMEALIADFPEEGIGLAGFRFHVAIKKTNEIAMRECSHQPKMEMGQLALPIFDSIRQFKNKLVTNEETKLFITERIADFGPGLNTSGSFPVDFKVSV